MPNYEMRGVDETRKTVQTFFCTADEDSMLGDHWAMESEEFLVDNAKVCFVEYYEDGCEMMVAQVVRVEGDEPILLEI